jgi:hypothetical protein
MSEVAFKRTCNEGWDVGDDTFECIIASPTP